MRGAKTTHNGLAVSEAANFLFAHILRLSAISPINRDLDLRDSRACAQVRSAKLAYQNGLARSAKNGIEQQRPAFSLGWS
jgi:hypothetical protein